MPHGAACAIIYILFYDRSWQGEVLRLMKDLFFFSISSRFGQFPEIFGQVKEWFMLELHGMIIVPHVVACLMDFNLFSDRVQQPGVLKPTKNDHFQIFLTVWVLFLKFSGRLRSGIY